MTERGEEWERLRQRVYGVWVKNYGPTLAPYNASCDLAKWFPAADRQRVEKHLLSTGHIDDATDYLWSLGVRG